MFGEFGLLFLVGGIVIAVVVGLIEKIDQVHSDHPRGFVPISDGRKSLRKGADNNSQEEALHRLYINNNRTGCPTSFVIGTSCKHSL